MEALKYEYYIYTWGGFYNEEYKKIHNYEKGPRWFNSKEERDDYITELKLVEKKLNARHLACHLDEGYCTRQPTILHRVVEYKGERIYSKNEINWCWEYSVAAFHNEYKWYPGFNDYAVCEHFKLTEDEIQWNEVKTIQEWITGAISLLHPKQLKED